MLLQSPQKGGGGARVRRGALTFSMTRCGALRDGKMMTNLTKSKQQTRALHNSVTLSSQDLFLNLLPFPSHEADILPRFLHHHHHHHHPESFRDD